jgi:predicted nucleic acid-binding protein
MKTVFVDANVFLRFLTVDDQGQHDRAVRLFRDAAAGRVSLLCGPPVLFEIAWTLRSAYRQSAEKILDVLGAIVAMPNLRLLDREIAEEALALARSSRQDFADAYIAASAQAAGADEMATFTRKHFERMGTRLASL